MTRVSVLLSCWSQKFPLKSGVLVTLRFSSVPVLVVSWRRFAKTRLDLFFLGFKLELVVNNLVSCSKVQGAKTGPLLLPARHQSPYDRQNLEVGSNLASHQA